MKQNERTLAEGLKKGDPLFQRLFFDSYSGRLASICSRYIADDQDVCDVLQEAFIKIFSHTGSFHFKGDGSLGAWAARITVNQALQFLRKKKSVPLEDLGDIPEEEDINTEDIPPDILHRLIRHLPDGYRTVFNLYVFEDMSHKEIARQLGIREDSSASQLLRARRLLQKQIIDYKNGRLEI